MVSEIERPPAATDHTRLLDLDAACRLQLDRTDDRSAVTDTTVELLHASQRVASHARCDRRDQHTTVAEHMPASDHAHREWTPQRFGHWAAGHRPGNLPNLPHQNRRQDPRLLGVRSHSLIEGVVCGVRVENVEDPLMRKLRCLDKLIGKLAKGKAMDKILRQ